MKKRTKSIFRLFIVPLIAVMLLQAAISFGTVFWSGTTDMLEEYSVGMLSQMVENRRIILENHMVQSWSNVSEEIEQVNGELTAILNREQITVEQFQADDALQKELLHSMLAPCLYMLRRNAVTGAFLLLADGAETQQGQECAGVYFRDADPNTNPGDYSDILMERGSSSFSQELHIPLDSFWTTNFHFGKPGERENDGYFYQPYLAALENPDMAWQNLAYWSKPFVLEDHSVADSYRMITYTAPLIREDGTVYGVIGVEISETYLAKLMPMQELDAAGQSGYVLGRCDAGEGLLPMFSTGAVTLRMEGGAQVPLEETGYAGFYSMTVDTPNQLYAYVSPLNLYNTNTPFAGDAWVLAGVQTQQNLFGIGDRTVRNLGVALLLGLIFGIACLALTVSHLTEPVRRLAECIRGSSGYDLRDYTLSNIAEVDGLYHVVQELTGRQKESEYELMEEKERYRIALQSSTDTLFSYDFQQNVLEVFSIDEKDPDSVVKYSISRQEMDRFREELIQEDDRQLLRDSFAQAQDVIDVVFEARDTKNSDKFHWMELTGKVICNTAGQRAKIIGGIKDIHEQRIRELAEADSLRRDPVTGLYKRITGERLIASELDAGHNGCLLLADVDDFRALNERYGSAVGDAALGQIGRLILDRKTRYDGLIAVRAGGDELEVWLRNVDTEEGRRFAEELDRQVGELYPEAAFALRLFVGVAGSRGAHSELLDHAAWALSCARAAGGSAAAVYDECPPELLLRAGGPAKIGGIANSGWSNHASMASQVFGFFDKSSDLGSILAVLLQKLGAHYELSDILVTEAEWEFCTVHVAHQWHRAGDAVKAEAHYFTEEEFRQILTAVSGGGRIYETNTPRQGREAEFFLLPEGAAGLVVPMFDSGRYCGAMVFAKRDGAAWGAQEQTELQEITKIVETNLNREKYDLASRAKSDFLSRMSHEIRTPMNAIIGMTDIALGEPEDPGRVQDCLHKIEQSSQYLLHLINDILDMSKIESGKMKLAAESFNLRKLAADVADMVRLQAEEKEVRLETEVELTEDWLVGDAFHLDQVLMNLLSNAIKFTPSGGSVTLSVCQVQAWVDEFSVRFSVRDTGIGISREHQARVFSAFEQADTNTVREYGGTGLGLAISSRLVRMMGSGIELDSAPGRGSNFSFTIRMKRGVSGWEDGPGTETAVKETALPGRRILVVEDNALNMTIAQTILSKNGMLVEQAVNGREAVERFSAHESGYYDLILMDIRMPVMDGLTATKEIRRLERPDARTVPILAMSANAFEEDVKKSLESGMNGHLAKPINVAELLRTLEEMLGGSPGR